jgi:iron complex transport system ATP-binding protein
VFNTLSKGERQNVLVARALITGPRILVLDEPCTGLDVYAREHTLNTIRSIAESNSATVLYVTHYPEEIMPFMNKTMLLKNGRVFAKGNTEDIMVAETLSALLEEPVTVTSNIDGTRSIHINTVSNIQEICYRRRVT